MPVVQNLQLRIGDYDVTIEGKENMNLAINYGLELLDDSRFKTGIEVWNLNLPADFINSKAFNTLYNPAVEDYTPTGIFSKFIPYSLIADGEMLTTGKCLIKTGSANYMPQHFGIEMWGGNADWVRNSQYMTLWDCLEPDNPHTFDDATIQASWNYDGNSRTNDYAYIPVRYKQPWATDPDTGTPNSVITVYHLRPSISPYWMIIRGFEQLGYMVDSTFMNNPLGDAGNDFFKRLVLAWTWGDFFDVFTQLQESVAFKASGAYPQLPQSLLNSNSQQFYTNDGQPGGSNWGVATPNTGQPSEVKTYVDSFGNTQTFNISTTNVPQGFDNAGTYTFDDTTGIMRWDFNPPSSLVSYFSGLGAQVPKFRLNLLFVADCNSGGDNIKLFLNYKINGGATTTFQMLECDSPNTFTFLTAPYSYEFAPNSPMSIGDHIEIWVSWTGAGTSTLQIQSSVWVNNNFINTGGGGAITAQRFSSNLSTNQAPPHWQLSFTSLELVSFYIPYGGQVDLRSYDKFRSYRFQDMLQGLRDMFDLQFQTDPIARTVKIEPAFTSKTQKFKDPIEGYFKDNIYLDYTDKLDVSKENIIEQWNEVEQVNDFQFAVDGNDGGANVYMSRYKAWYPNNLGFAYQDISKGMKSIAPGAARYVFPDRFAAGVRSLTNKFFSPLMHYMATEFYQVFNSTPQLPVIIPENVSNTGSSGIEETFMPKLMYYKGYMTDGALYGALLYNPQYDSGQLINPVTNVPSAGDLLYPQLPQNPAAGSITIGIGVPMAFMVNYKYIGKADPVLTYCDQYLDGQVVPGLMKNYYLRRLAIQRHGKVYHANLTLNFNDITNWFHREGLHIEDRNYWLINIANYKPFDSENAACTMWQDWYPEQSDVDRCYPSNDSVANMPNILTDPFDLRYAPLLINNTDIPT